MLLTRMDSSNVGGLAGASSSWTSSCTGGGLKMMRRTAEFDHMLSFDVPDKFTRHSLDFFPEAYAAAVREAGVVDRLSAGAPSRRRVRPAARAPAGVGNAAVSTARVGRRASHHRDGVVGV